MEDQPESSKSPSLSRVLSFFALGLMAIVVAALIYAGAQYLYRHGTRPQTSASQGTEPTLIPEPDGVLKTTSESFRMIAKKVGPAVVSVKSTKTDKSGGEGRHDGDDDARRDPFFDFFEQFGWHNPLAPRERTPQISMGSGILIDREGRIVTNNHVIADGNEIVVTLGEDKTEYKAQIVGTDPKTDLAVIKLMSLPNLPEPPEWANSDTVEVGDWAIAIGSPFALGQSVTVGIVSAKGRREPMTAGGAEVGNDLIQTDAAINPGNSGGPLCDLEGKIMGVNTAIYTRNGGYMGIGFAIPSNLVKDISTKLVRDGKIVRGWLGVYIQPLEPDMAHELGVKSGVGIHEVVQKGPAAAAGLRAGDIIVEVNGSPVKEIDDLQEKISDLKPGQVVKLKVISYTTKRTRTVSVSVGELPSTESMPKEEKVGEPDRLGLAVEAVPQGKGVIVRAVEPQSMAEEVGIEPGDIITVINRKPIDGMEAYRKALASAKWISLELRRKGQTLFLQFSLPE